MNNLQKILELEKISRQLEPDAAQRKAVRDDVIQYTENFIDKIETIPAFAQGRKESEVFFHSPISEEPTALPEILSTLESGLENHGVNSASGGNFGFIPGGGLYYSALGDYWADITNRYAGMFFVSPGAVRMENMLIKWTAALAGYPLADVAGNLTSGGSMANFSAIVTARDEKKITSDKIKQAVIYLSPEVHHCVNKAIRIAGLAECIIRRLPLDEGYHIKPDALEKLVIADKAQGLIPFLVVASAGTTDTGSVDPLHAIGKIANQHGLWYHVDAAYGGYFLLTAYGKKIFHGIELSDSFAIDPHKGLCLPYGSGMLVVKDKRALYNAHYYKANYLQDALDANEELSSSDLSAELSRHFRGLRLWLPLKLLGLKPFRANLEEKLLLARYFYDEIKKLGFETGPYPDLSVVTYRYIPQNFDANLFNKQLVEELEKDGRIFVSSTMLEDRFMLRFAALSFRTHLSTVDALLNILKEKVEMLDKE